MRYYFALEVIILILGILFSTNRKSTDIVNLKIRKVNNYLYISKEYIFILVSSVVLILFMGRRSNFAQDYNNYVKLFQSVADKTFKEVLLDNNSVEVGYRLLNKTISVISTDTCFFMTIIAAIFVFCIVYEGCYEVTNTFWFIMLFLNIGIYFLSFNLMRQCLAAAIVYVGTRYLRTGQKWKYLVIILLATTIHTTSLFMFLTFPFMTRKINKRNVIQLLIIGIVGWLFLFNIINFIQKYKYTGYVYGMGSANSLNGVIVQWSVFVFATYAAITRRIDIKSTLGEILINGSIFFMITSVWGLQVIQISRLSYFFSPYLMAYGANAVGGVCKKNGMKFFKPIIIILLVSYMYVWLFDTSYASYEFCW